MENEKILSLKNKKLKIEIKLLKELNKLLETCNEDLIDDNIIFVNALELVCQDLSDCKNLIADNVIRKNYSNLTEEYYIEKASNKLFNCCSFEAIKIKNIIKEFKGRK